MITNDIAVIWINGAGDIEIEGDDLKTDDSLTNMIIHSLFTDRAVTEPELDKDQRNRGWWGDSFSSMPWGSRLWLLEREKSQEEVCSRAEDYSYEALNWLIDAELIQSTHVTATRESIQRNSIKDWLQITILLTLKDGVELQRKVRTEWLYAV